MITNAVRCSVHTAQDQHPQLCNAAHMMCCITSVLQVTFTFPFLQCSFTPASPCSPPNSLRPAACLLCIHVSWVWMAPFRSNPIYSLAAVI